MDYDQLFRQQACLDPTLPWNCLHPSLVASTTMGRHPGSGTFCTICQGFDHIQAHCSLAYLQNPPPRDNSKGLCSEEPACHGTRVSAVTTPLLVLGNTYVPHVGPNIGPRTVGTPRRFLDSSAPLGPAHPHQAYPLLLD